MTPEDTNRIIAAIDRNTQAVKSRQDWMFISLMLVVFFLGILLSAITAHASPILTTPEPIYKIGTPPLPPPNPHVQYWHTQYVPGPDGVLPVEVFAPRLVARVASNAVEVPEPRTWLIIALVAAYLGWLIGRGMLRDQLLVSAGFAVLSTIHKSINITRRAYCPDSRCMCERCLTTGMIEKDLQDISAEQIARKALEESK